MEVVLSVTRIIDMEHSYRTFPYYGIQEQTGTGIALGEVQGCGNKPSSIVITPVCAFKGKSVHSENRHNLSQAGELCSVLFIQITVQWFDMSFSLCNTRIHLFILHSLQTEAAV